MDHFRLILCVVTELCSAVSAQAECFTAETGKRPTSIDFGEAGLISQIKVDGRILTYSSVTPDGVTATIRADGLFSLGVDRSDGMRRHFKWSDELPALEELTVGASFEHFALIFGDGFVPFRYAAEVIGEDEFRVGECSYRVLEVAVRQGPADEPQMIGRRWFDPWTLLTYRTELEFYDANGNVTRRQESRAVQME